MSLNVTEAQCAQLPLVHWHVATSVHRALQMQAPSPVKKLVVAECPSSSFWLYSCCSAGLPYLETLVPWRQRTWHRNRFFHLFPELTVEVSHFGWRLMRQGFLGMPIPELHCQLLWVGSAGNSQARQQMCPVSNKPCGSWAPDGVHGRSTSNIAN